MKTCFGFRHAAQALALIAFSLLSAAWTPSERAALDRFSADPGLKLRDPVLLSLRGTLRAGSELQALATHQPSVKALLADIAKNMKRAFEEPGW